MTLKVRVLPFLTTFTQLTTRLKNFLRGWLLIFGLKEGLVECATVCVKSEVILITNLAHIRLSLFHSDRLAVTIKAPVWKTRYQLSEFKSRYRPFCIFFYKMVILKSSLHNFLKMRSTILYKKLMN